MRAAGWRENIEMSLNLSLLPAVDLSMCTRRSDELSGLFPSMALCQADVADVFLFFFSSSLHCGREMVLGARRVG